MRCKKIFELILVLVMVALLSSYISKAWNGPDSEDLLLYLPFDGDSRSQGSLSLETTAAGVTFEDDGRQFAVFGVNSYVVVPEVSAFNGMEEFTLSAWVKPTQLREHLNVISKVKPDRDFNLQIDHRGRVLTHIAVGDYEFCYTERPIETGRWTHLAATFQHNVWTIYVDGQVAAQQEVQRAPAWTGSALTVGNLYPGSTEGFIGGLDEVRVYKRALSAIEVAYLQTR